MFYTCDGMLSVDMKLVRTADRGRPDSADHRRRDHARLTCGCRSTCRRAPGISRRMRSGSSRRFCPGRKEFGASRNRLERIDVPAAPTAGRFPDHGRPSPRISSATWWARWCTPCRSRSGKRNWRSSRRSRSASSLYAGGQDANGVRENAGVEGPEGERLSRFQHRGPGEGHTNQFNQGHAAQGARGVLERRKDDGKGKSAKDYWGRLDQIPGEPSSLERVMRAQASSRSQRCVTNVQGAGTLSSDSGSLLNSEPSTSAPLGTGRNDGWR